MDYKNLNTITLAFVGDAVYEQFVRIHLIRDGIAENYGADRLHKDAVRYVKASQQSKVIRSLIDDEALNETEKALVLRARNHKIATKAKNATPMDYKWATAFEALLGYLKLSGQEDRLAEIMTAAAGIIEA